MRCAVIIERDGRQVLGITSDEALRIGKQGIAEFQFSEYTMRFIVEPDTAASLPAATPALPWKLDLEV